MNAASRMLITDCTSTVSKVLRQKEKYLFPEDRSLSPIKRAKGKFPDIERALANWVRNSQKQGHPITDAVIKEKAHFFATTVGSTESHMKANSPSWLEKFKQKNGIGSGNLLRRASETNISESGSFNQDSGSVSASQTPNGISPTSPCLSPLSGSKSSESLKTDSALDSFLDFSSSTYRHSNSHSTTSLSSSTFTNDPSSFSGGPTSPTTPNAFSFSPTDTPFMPSQQSRLPAPSSFQRPRSQTFPMLGIDPSFLTNTEPVTPKWPPNTSSPTVSLDSPIHELPPFTLNTAISPSSTTLPPSATSTTASSISIPLPHSNTSTSSTLSSPPPSSPTQDDARRALDTLLTFFNSAPQGLVDHQEYLMVLKLTEKLRLQSATALTGQMNGLERIPEGEGLNLKGEGDML
jgi:hypothetical protein